MRSAFPAALLAFWGVLLAATLLCMAFADQPVALFFSTESPLARHLFQAAALPSLAALPLSVLYLAWAVARKLGGAAKWRGAPRLEAALLAMSLATLGATAAKDELKWLFGRSWPQFWLHDGIYGFRPLTDSYYYGSFPSGHTAYISAPLAVLWALEPRWRPFCAVLTGLVMLGLVGADYHYTADVLAGLLTGTICAWATLVLLRPRRN